MIRTILSSGLIRQLVIMALAATLAGMLSVALFTPTGAAQVVLPKTESVVTGYSKGLATKGFPSQGVPLLKTFFFQYVRCEQQTAYCFGQVDNHISQILIQPNFPAQDKIHLGFQDQNPTGLTDLYNYNVQHYVLTSASKIRRYDTGLDVDVGQATKTISKPTPLVNHAFVLLGFQLYFRGRDNHINEVGIDESLGKVTVTFVDKSGVNSGDLADTFYYRIWYAYVPRDVFTSLGERNGTDAGGFAQQDIPPGPAVIRGFHFDFTSDDNHLKDIGVVNRGGRLQVGYADKDDKNAFNWRVKWGILRK